MTTMSGRIFSLLTSGAEVKNIRGVGFLILDKGPRRIRRTKAQMAQDVAKEVKSDKRINK